MKIKLLVLVFTALSIFSLNAKNDVIPKLPNLTSITAVEEANTLFRIVVVYKPQYTSAQRNNTRLAIWAELEAGGNVQFSRMFGSQGNTETWTYWFNGHPGGHVVKDAVIDTGGIDVCEGDPSDCID